MSVWVFSPPRGALEQSDAFVLLWGVTPWSVTLKHFKHIHTHTLRFTLGRNVGSFWGDAHVLTHTLKETGWIRCQNRRQHRIYCRIGIFHGNATGWYDLNCQMRHFVVCLLILSQTGGLKVCAHDPTLSGYICWDKNAPSRITNSRETPWIPSNMFLYSCHVVVLTVLTEHLWSMLDLDKDRAFKLFSVFISSILGTFSEGLRRQRF